MKLVLTLCCLLALATAISIRDSNTGGVHKRKTRTGGDDDSDDAQQQQEDSTQEDGTQEDSTLIQSQQQETGGAQQQQQQQQQETGGAQQQQQQQQQEDGAQQQEQEAGQQQQQEDGQQQEQEDGQQQQQQQQQEDGQQQQQQQQQEDGQQQQQQEDQQQQQEEDDQEQQQEDGQEQQQEDSQQEEGAYTIEASGQTYFEVFVNGVLLAHNMPLVTKTGFSAPEEGKKDSISFDLAEGETPHTVVIHGFAPKLAHGTIPWIKFKGGNVVSSSDSFQCAKNWAEFWKDGKTLSPNYYPADVTVPNEDHTSPQEIWVNDRAQHHVTCTWTARSCLSLMAKNPNEPCENMKAEGADWELDARYSLSPKISREAGSSPTGTTPIYDKLALSKVPDLPSTQKLAVEQLAHAADEQHEEMAGRVDKACADPLCKGLYSL